MRIPGRQVCAPCEASSEEHHLKIAAIQEQLHVKMGSSAQGREKADRWMMWRRKRVIRLKNVMEKSSGGR